MRAQKVAIAACTNEVFKLVTSAAAILPNYMQYSADQGVYTFTFCHERKPDCPVCGDQGTKISVSPTMELGAFLLTLADYGFHEPDVRTSAKSLYLRKPDSLELQLRPNLVSKMIDLVKMDEELFVTEEGKQQTFRIEYTSP